VSTGERRGGRATRLGYSNLYYYLRSPVGTSTVSYSLMVPIAFTVLVLTSFNQRYSIMANETATVSDLFDWANQDDFTFMKTVIRFERESSTAVVNISDRVFRMAVKFNNPERPSIAAMQFKKYVANLAENVKAEDSSVNLVVFGFKAGSTEITGNGAFASAFKRVFAAMYYGADLTKEFEMFGDRWIITSASMCAKFAKKAAEVERQNTTLNKLRKDLELDMASDEEWMNKMDTPDAQRELNRRVTAAMERQTQARADSGEDKQAEDKYDHLGRIFASDLRKIAEKSETTAEQLIEAFQNKLDNTLKEFFGANSQEYLSRKAG